MSRNTSLSDTYKSNRESGAVMKKTFLMPLDVVACDVDNNIRALNEEHVAKFAASYQAGQEVPPVYVYMDGGFPTILDGHHRFYGALKAGVDLIECKEFKGNEAERLVFMMQSSEGRALTFLEKAIAMKQLHEFMTAEEIGLAMSVSRTDVGNKLVLAEADEDIHTLVEEEKISGTLAVEYVTKYGVDALAKIEHDLSRAADAGKTKVTAASGKASPFSPARMRGVMELLGKGLEYNIQELGRAKDVGGDVTATIELDVDEMVELVDAIDDYLDQE